MDAKEIASDANRPVQPQDNAADIMKAVLVMIRVWGRVTGRVPEAEGIAISVLNGMQKG